MNTDMVYMPIRSTLKPNWIMFKTHWKRLHKGNTILIRQISTKQKRSTTSIMKPISKLVQTKKNSHARIAMHEFSLPIQLCILICEAVEGHLWIFRTFKL